MVKSYLARASPRYIVYFSYVGIQILKFLKNLTKAIAIFLFMCYVLSIVSITCFYSCITLTRELVTVFHNRIKGASGHCTGTEWGEKPREWVTVMRARRAQSDTSEPDLCSCRHRESMDEFFVRTAGGCADFLSGAFPPPESAVRKAAQPMCFPGSLRRSPSAVCCQQKSPLRRWEPPKGDFLR